MAEHAGDKSFEATPHRRQEAREKGHVAFSQDLGSAVTLMLSVLLLVILGGGVIAHCANLMRGQLGDVPELATSQETLLHEWVAVAVGLAGVVLPILGLMMLGGVLTSILQVGFLWVPGRFLIDISRDTMLWSGLTLLVLALFDFALHRWKHEQDLRMTHQEVREEMKNLQGDPQIVARRRSIQRQMVLNRIASSVPKADVVVTNPTELAVAIQYDPEEMAAPIVVAKGAGVIAQRIRRLALEHNIPIIERKPLAQLLYKEVDIGRAIPAQSYAAVAEVLAYVYQLKGKKMPTPRAA
jgi:flagellar biosynthetic protein FlhB